MLGTLSEPGSIDPAFASTPAAHELGRLAYLELTELDERWRVVPRLAEALPTARTSSAGFTVRWKLRQGYSWSDGAPVTAVDAVFGAKIESNPKLEAANHEVAQRIVRIEAEGVQTFVVHWRSAFADYLAPKVHAVLPGHAYPEPTGVAFAGLGRQTIASGPYRVQRWVAGQHVVFERNPHFGGARPAIDEIVFRFFSSEDALEAELLTGGIDAVGEAAGLGLERAEQLAVPLAESHEVVYTDSGMWLHLTPRLDHPVLANAAVRRAIAMAVDREVLAELVYGGRATPAFGLYPPRHPGFDPDGATLPFDPEAAAAAVRAAGHAGQALTLEYMTSSQAGARAAAYLKEALERIGLSVTMSAAPPAVVMDHLSKRPAALTLLAFRMRPDWDGASALVVGGLRNFSGYADPEITAALGRAQATMDPDAWGAILRGVDAEFRRTLPLIPLLYRQAVSVRPKGLEGWRPTGTTTPVTWNAELWRIDTP